MYGINPEAICACNLTDADYKIIKMPVLIIQGEKDLANPVENEILKLRKAIKHAKIEILPNVNHFPITEVPAKSIELIRNFLNSI